MSSQNGGRSPKDLRHLLSVARQDDSFFPEEIELNLAKLKSLSKDELSENSMLRDRIDQQCELICILKKQADSSLNKSLILEREMKELQTAKEETVCKYHDQIRKYTVLEKRFETLFHNHEEIIKIKDGYKQVNDELRRENEDLLNKKKEEESVVINRQNARIKMLKEEVANLEEKFQQTQKNLRTLKEQLVSSENQSCAMIENLKIKASNAEQRAQEIKKKEQDISLRLLASENEIKKLLREKTEYTQLAFDQKQISHKQELQITELLAKVQELESSLKRQSENFKKQFEEASADIQVQRLKIELTKAEQKIRNHEKEFDAYRTHTEKLLSKERELNCKLRQLIG